MARALGCAYRYGSLLPSPFLAFSLALDEIDSSADLDLQLLRDGAPILLAKQIDPLNAPLDELDVVQIFLYGGRNSNQCAL
jgi:hypothetical protein